MFKFFGRNDIVRDNEVFDGSQKYRSLEYYTGNDHKTAYNIERPIRNLEENQYELIRRWRGWADNRESRF